MMTAAVTAQIYFRSCQKKARPLYQCCTQRHIRILRLWNVILSEQHMARHDVSFPASYGGVQGAFEKKRIIPYTVMLTLMMIVNYYISYMIVVFILLFMALFAAGVTARRKKYKDVPCRFVIGSPLVHCFRRWYGYHASAVFVKRTFKVSYRTA